MDVIVKEIEVVKSFGGDDWYAKCIGQKFAVMDPTWWSLAEGDCYYVEHPENNEDTVHYVLRNDCKVTKSVARSAPETTEILNEVAADKGILTEEELKGYETSEAFLDEQRATLDDVSVDAAIVNKIIASHRNLFSANAELSFKNKDLNKKIDQTVERLESIEKEFYHEQVRELERCRSQAKYARELLK